MAKFKEGQVLYWKDRSDYHNGSYIVKVTGVMSHFYVCKVLFRTNIKSNVLSKTDSFFNKHGCIGFEFNSRIEKESVVLDDKTDYRLQAVMMEL